MCAPYFAQPKGLITIHFGFKLLFQHPFFSFQSLHLPGSLRFFTFCNPALSELLKCVLFLSTASPVKFWPQRWLTPTKSMSGLSVRHHSWWILIQVSMWDSTGFTVLQFCSLNPELPAAGMQDFYFYWMYDDRSCISTGQLKWDRMSGTKTKTNTFSWFSEWNFHNRGLESTGDWFLEAAGQTVWIRRNSSCR